jgi:uncharacterized membrane protein
VEVTLMMMVMITPTAPRFSFVRQSLLAFHSSQVIPHTAALFHLASSISE